MPILADQPNPKFFTYKKMMHSKELYVNIIFTRVSTTLLASVL